MNRKKIFSILFIFAAMLLLFSSLQAQEEIKIRIFKEVDNLFLKARSEQADLLSPENYKKAVEKHEEALKLFGKGKNVDDKIEETIKWLNLSIKTAERAKQNLSHLIKAREDALNANVIDFSRDLFEKAEKLFEEATRALEKSDMSKSKEKALQAEKLFREAELKAIKTSIIGPVRKRLEAAEKNKLHKIVPTTLAKASNLLESAEAILNSNRLAQADAKEKAEKANYELSHAEFLARQIKELKEDDLNWEKLILDHEAHLIKIGTALSLQLEFDNGFKKPAESILKAIESLKQQRRDMSAEIAELNKSVTQLENEKAKLQEQLEAEQQKLKAKLSEAEQKQLELKKKLAEEERRKEKFKKLESIFSADEAKVMREGNNIIIRLIGLNFASGKSNIDPDYFGLLTKVQRAIRTFPDYHITIEGHTDNRGDARKNQSLSLNRARSVMSYLMANMGLTADQISAIGYGETKPIASNETAKGRAQNRRIDIVLSPTNNN